MFEQVQPSDAVAADLDFRTILRRVGAEVLETMFFDEAVATPCDHGWIPSASSVCVAFEGSHCGEFLLSVSPEVARAIAPAFLGVDPEEVAEDQSSQVLLELANILCGSVLSHVWPDSDLRLEPPELIRAERPIGDAAHECFLLPEGMLAVSIRMCRPDGPD
jgi:Chemotaxis phosphatase CheX